MKGWNKDQQTYDPQYTEVETCLGFVRAITLLNWRRAEASKTIQNQADFAIEKISGELDRRLENLGSLMHEKFVRTQTFSLIEVE